MILTTSPIPVKLHAGAALRHEEREAIVRLDSPARGRLHHHLALALAERIREAVLVVPGQDVAEPRLPAVLVYPLRDLVPRGVSETWEEREQPLAQGRARVVLEDDCGERRGRHLRACAGENGRWGVWA